MSERKRRRERATIKPERLRRYFNQLDPVASRALLARLVADWLRRFDDPEPAYRALSEDMLALAFNYQPRLRGGRGDPEPEPRPRPGRPDLQVVGSPKR